MDRISKTETRQREREIGRAGTKERRRMRGKNVQGLLARLYNFHSLSNHTISNFEYTNKHVDTFEQQRRRKMITDRQDRLNVRVTSTAIAG